MFRSMLRAWLQRTAHQQVRDKVMEAARRKAEEAAGTASQAGEEPEETPPCDVGVVFALSIESGGLEDLVTDLTTIRGGGLTILRGRLGERHVTLVRSGAGREAAARATEALIDGHQPDWVISAGLAGGLVSALGRHDLLVADSLLDASGDRLDIDLRVDPESLKETPGVHVGTLLTVDRIARTPKEKRALAEKHPALAVDMETFATAQVCARRGVRLLAVRVIGDAVDEEMAPEVRGLLKQKSGAAQFGAALGAIWNRPSSVKDMYQMRENALLASDRLAKFLAGMVEQLGESG